MNKCVNAPSQPWLPAKSGEGSMIGKVLSTPKIFVARTFGILWIALGFIAGMEGLAHPDSLWLRTAFGLIVTGLLAQAFALFSTLRRARQIQNGKNSEDSEGGGNVGGGMVS